MDGVNTKHGHPLYNVWHWLIKMHTSNGMVCERWLDFWNFAEDVGVKPDTGSEKCHFHRHYFDKPYGPGNWRWKTFPKNDEYRRKRAIYARQYRARKMAEDPDFHKHWLLKRSYGIGIHEYRALLEKQNNSCAICGGKEKSIAQTTKKNRRFAVDHCHKTGKIRGLLCSHCNTGLGSFQDNPEFLQNAINYLRETIKT